MRAQYLYGVLLGVLATALAIVLSTKGSPWGCAAGNLPAATAPTQGIHQIALPDGFRIQVFASGVENARSMALAPGGTLFVGSRAAGRVYAVTGPDGKVKTIASGLRSPNGVALKEGNLFVAEIGRILRFDNIEASLDKPPSPVVVQESFPDDEHHGWKFIAFGPDQQLYVPVGAPCNVCKSKDERYATIMRMSPDGSDLSVYAEGVRNTVGFDWHPDTGDLWFTDNGRDWMGDNRPPDELNHAPRSGLHFGFPYCHGADLQDPEYNTHPCEAFRAPALTLGPHVAALGMRFYDKDQFPENYRGGIFIAEHGSWNRSTPIGYRIMYVPFKAGRPTGYEVFAEGWLQGTVAWGRPVDVLVTPDGALLVSDDKAGAIYRISYDN